MSGKDLAVNQGSNKSGQQGIDKMRKGECCKYQ